DGKEIFLAASTDVGLSSGWLDLSSYQHPVLRNVYAVVLKKGDKSPVEPESDEEKIGDKEKKEDDKKDADKKDGDKKDADKKADKKKDGDKDKDNDKEKKEEPAKTV